MNEQELLRHWFGDSIKPDPVLTVSEWADKYRRLSSASAESGRWRTSRVPFMRDVMDCLSPSDPCNEVVVIKPSQCGGTEAGNNFLGFAISEAPGPFMYALPTEILAKRTSRQKIGPMLQDTPCLNEKTSRGTRGTGNNILQKSFPGMELQLVGANAPAGLRSMSAKYVYADELDGWTLDNGEGDPLGAIKKRLTTFPKSKLFLTSTPVDKETSRIEPAYERTDKRMLYVPCPYCERMQTLRWANLKFEKDEENFLIGDVRYRCEQCGELIDEYHKTKMLSQYEWIADRPDRINRPGFRLNGLYSPIGWASWNGIVEEFLEAHRERDKAKLKLWTNTVLAETWEDEEAEEIDDDSLYGRREDYGPEIPYEVGFLTASVDAQSGKNRRLECEVIGWGRLEESWSIDYQIFDGDPAKPEVWEELDEYLKTKFIHKGGTAIGIGCTCIDTGGHYTNETYKFVRGKRNRKVYGIKGSSIPGKPIVTAPGKNSKASVALYMVGTDTAKESIFHRLEIDEPGPGYCHFPKGYDQEYFKQLTSEKSVLRKGVKVWIKKSEGRSNEALDLRVYNLAALAIAAPPLEKLCEIYQAGETPVFRKKKRRKQRA